MTVQPLRNGNLSVRDNHGKSVAIVTQQGKLLYAEKGVASEAQLRQAVNPYLPRQVSRLDVGNLGWLLS